MKGSVQQNVMFPPDAGRPGERAGQGNPRRTGAGKCASIGIACQGARPSHCLIVASILSICAGASTPKRLRNFGYGTANIPCTLNAPDCKKATGSWTSN